jgi:hypothetical protein
LGALQSFDSGAIDDIRAGGASRIDEQPIQHVPSRRVQGVDPVTRRNRHRNGLVAVEERRLPYGRGAGGGDRRQNAPAMQLDDGATHERVGGERVGAVAPAIDHEHAVPGTREQHCRGRAGASRADNDHVITGCRRLRRAPARCLVRTHDGLTPR